MKENLEITFTTPSDANIDLSTYIEDVKGLIKRERESDPTVVLHTDEEIWSKYKYSIIAVLNKKIIWNSSIYDSKMKPLHDLSLQGKKIKVWESWSVIIHPDYRWMWIGKKLTTISLQRFSPNYDIIVGATVNNIMFNLRMHQGFETIPFPKELYEEWKKYLAPFMKDWDVEFEDRAKCMMYNFKLSNEQKKALIHILEKEYSINQI